MRKIKKGDEVIVITGKDKGKRGDVSQVIEDKRVVVENINVAKKHTKGDPNRGVPGGIIDKEMAMDISNIAIFNPTTQKADRVGIKKLDDGKKIRIFKSNGEAIDA